MVNTHRNPQREGLKTLRWILNGVVIIPNFIIPTFVLDIFMGIIIGTTYSLVIVLEYWLSKNTFQSLGFQSVAVISAVVLSFRNVGMISYLLIQGFLWTSSTPYLRHDSSENKHYTSAAALKLLFEKVSNIGRQFAQLGMLGVTGAAVVLAAAILSSNDANTFPEAQLFWLVLATAYFSTMFCVGILLPLEAIKKEIILRVDDLEKQKEDS